MVADGAGVSFVMPVLNERRYLQRAVETTLAQEVDGPTELVLALGPSTDGTTELAERLAAADPRITLVDNPGGRHPDRAEHRHPGEHACRRSCGSTPTPSWRRTTRERALATLARTRAANVGGVMRADGRTPFQRAVARAYNSPIGLGGGAYHGGTHEGEAESAYLGVMRRSVLDEVGLFDETIRRGEDWELNLRIRAAGYRVWFDPALAVTYWPRESWVRLARQFHATGTWRGELVRRYGRRNSRALLRAARARTRHRPEPRGGRPAAHRRADGMVGARGIRRLPAGARVRAAGAGGRAGPRRRQGMARQALDARGAADDPPDLGRRLPRRPRCAARTTRSTRAASATATRRCRRALTWSRSSAQRSMKPWSSSRDTTRSAACPSSRALNLRRHAAYASAYGAGVVGAQGRDQLVLRAHDRPGGVRGEVEVEARAARRGSAPCRARGSTSACR